ncbi:MAG: M23 family metallopeptidase [Thermodesulfobacteriota bacterium]
MKPRLHIVITGETGATRAFVVSKTRLKTTLLLAASLFVGLAVGTAVSFTYFVDNLVLVTSRDSLKDNLETTQVINQRLQDRIRTQEASREEQLQTALAELAERSRRIEAVLSSVGVELPVHEDAASAGGPFAAPSQEAVSEITFKVDSYLDAVSAVPLGAPVTGTLSSAFGRRRDPVNNRPAFHGGIDIRQQYGTPVTATANGRVRDTGYSGAFGNYVEIEHGNGFVTYFYHLKKALVPRDAVVERGQVVGLLGSSGRSTGPHLHYAIHFQDQPLDPMRFVQVAGQGRPVEEGLP